MKHFYDPATEQLNEEGIKASKRIHRRMRIWVKRELKGGTSAIDLERLLTHAVSFEIAMAKLYREAKRIERK